MNAAWVDEPWRSGDPDPLLRRAYAARAADLIRSSHSFDSSVVFGLSGPWGSGKTSMVNMIVEQLGENDSAWAVARFTPWATTDITGLITEFYSSLTHVLPRRRGKDVKTALANLTRVAAPAATLIPFAGGGAAEALRASSEWLAKTPPWNDAFKSACEQLKKLGIPILVVVDDIDRLHADELTTLLKVVRLLGRLPGVQYLLAYDDDTILRSLRASLLLGEHDGSAERFMEKIVQYPLIVPPLLRHQQIDLLRAGILRDGRFEEGSLALDRLDGLMDCFVALLQTPRAIDRYFAQIRHHLPLLPAEEIDDGDVMLLTLLRVRFPEIFNSLPELRYELTHGHRNELDLSGDTTDLGTTMVRYNSAPLIELAPKHQQDAVRNVVLSLFPKLDDGKGSTLQPSIPPTTSRGIGTEEYFDRYFAMVIPENDVSDAVVKDAVVRATVGESDAFLSLFGPKSRAALPLILQKAQAATAELAIDGRANVDTLSDDRRLSLATALARAVAMIGDKDFSVFSVSRQTLNWMGEQLRLLSNDVDSHQVLQALQELPGTVERLICWSAVTRDSERALETETIDWRRQVSEALANEAAEGFLAHLELGDAAPIGPGVGYQVRIALRYGMGGRLRDSIATLLDSQKIDLATLASRLVGLSSSGDTTKYEIHSIDQEVYDQLAPAGDDPFYSIDPGAVDMRDISWANRRRYSGGRYRPPPPEGLQRGQ